MNVSDAMNRNVITVRPDTSLLDAVRIMLANRVSGLPVLDEKGELVGVVTEGDLLRREEIGTGGGAVSWFKALLKPSRAAADYVATHARRVGSVMTQTPIYVTPKTPLADAVEVMVSKHFKRLPVVENGTLVGTLSRSDLLRQLASKLMAMPNETLTDEQITADLESEIKKAKWAPRTGVQVSVKDAVVTLGGTIFSDEERLGVITLAENSAGVKHVVDELVFVDPSTGLAFPSTGSGI